MDDRTILRSPFPALPLDRLGGMEWPEAQGRTVVVNTVYTVTLAVEALIAAANAQHAIVALTEALCSKRPFSDDERAFFQKKYPTVGFDHISSVCDLVVKCVLPRSGALLIVNESELQHLSDVPIFRRISGKRFRLLGPSLEALQCVRTMQGDRKGRIFFTMGREGSLCLDEEGVLHHCGVTDVPGPIAGKTGIGDAYAAMVMGYEHVKRAIGGEVPEVWHQIVAAAGAADVAVAKGPRAVTVLGVDGGVMESWKKYTKLGDLASVKMRAEEMYEEGAQVRLEDVDWRKLSMLQGRNSKLFGPTLLEDDLGRQWLRPPFANSAAESSGDYAPATTRAL